MPSHPDAPSRSQSANLSGEGHVNVQIQGDNNVVHLGRSRLDLTLYRGRRREAVTSSGVEAGEAAEILSPYAMAVPLIGRERELADLRAWMDGDPDLSIRVMTALGGGGKTRLALELCEEAVRQGWNAGFVKAAATVDAAVASLARPTLAVVDYAAARLPWLREWLDDLASSPPGGGKLRVLLLERHADPDLDWWAETFRSGSWGDAAIRRRLDPADGPYKLPPLRPVDQRRAVLEATLRSVRSDLQLPSPTERPDFDSRLAELTWGGEPLFLLMAALTAARCGLKYLLSIDRSQLAFDVAEHELKRIAMIAESQVPRSTALARHMAAYVTLCQGLARDQAEDAIEVEKGALRYVSVGDPPEIYRIMHAALPGAAYAISPILPDVVGEAAVLIALGNRDPNKAREAAVRASTQIPERVQATVVRIVQDFGDIDARPLDWLHRLADEVMDLKTLSRLVDLLPQRTIALRALAVKLTAALLERLPADNREEVARVSNNLSNRLSELGQREEALKLVRKAVSIRRDLAQSWPDRFRSSLAGSLNNLSNHLTALGRREEALAAAQEAVVLNRELSRSRPDLFLADLAIALRTLSVAFQGVGSREEALQAAQEGVSIWRKLSLLLSNVFLPDLAGGLETLANRLADLERLSEALNAGQESVDLYRELSQWNPDAFRLRLMVALGNLAIHLRALDRRDEALTRVKEAVDLYRVLSQLGPDALGPEVAAPFHTHALVLHELGRSAEAVEASEKAVRILLPFFQALPAAFSDWMGNFAMFYQILSEENGRHPDSALMEAINSIFRRSNSQNPQSHPLLFDPRSPS